jgi:NAD(P)-dependent dehydrogenase (short-subunit alcohol dehydrogenase family)
MEGLVKDKVVVITGAGSGVGRAACLLFARHGAKVMALDVNAQAVSETAAQVEAEGGTAAALTCNVADSQAVTDAVAATVEKFGRLDIIYNNAGISSPANAQGGAATFIENSDADDERLLGVNLRGIMNGCRAAIRQFQAQGGGGVIVNTASVAGLIGWGGTLYGATKGGVTSLTRTLAIEVAKQGIRVNSVCPAAMQTNFFGGKTAEMPKEMLDALNKMHPLGRTIDPMECANGALFLASDMASNITGVNLPVDGGLSAGRQM